MYEHKTFENILSSLLESVAANNSEIDIRPGSIIYTALAPIALELETAYRELDATLEETFLETASKDYLIKHGQQLGVELNEATYGHYVGEFDVEVNIGDRFNLDAFNYAVIDKISNPTDENQYYTFELVCETAGTTPNAYLGDLTPITFVNNLTHAKLTSVIVYGEDEEETEAYRYRLLTHIQKQSLDANVYQYEEWLNAYDGVGKYKVLPCWNGTNTVKLVILNSENRAASDEFIDQVQKDFDPPTSQINDTVTNSTYPQGRGMGNGQAPIGAIITVDTPTEIPVVINCTLTVKEGYSSVNVAEVVDNYLKSIIFEKNSIAYMPISAKIYDVDGVEDVTSLAITVKGKTMDASVSPFITSVAIGDNEIAVLDAVNSRWGG